MATRVNNELVYNLHDPSGMSLVMTDVDGNEVGRMMYDGFGSVLTSTVPITFTGAMADVPDATTGLVYQGGGRWYDPALGRPLQPNAAGAPPTVPQALNRYAATPLGQPGVFQATISSQWYDALELLGCCQSFDIAVDTAALVVGQQIGLEAYLSSRTAQLIHSGGGLPHFARNNNAQGGVRIKEGVYSLTSPHSDARVNNNRMRWLQRRLGDGSLAFSEPGRLNRLMNYEVTPVARRLGFAVEEFKVGEALDGGAVGFFFDAGWQIAQDWGNPYLNPWQKVGRGIVAGSVGLVAGFGVAAVVGTGGVGFVVAVGVGWLIEAPASQWIFEYTGLEPTRNLAQLQ